MIKTDHINEALQYIAALEAKLLVIDQRYKKIQEVVNTLKRTKK